jgi:glutathione S-transferase
MRLIPRVNICVDGFITDFYGRVFQASSERGATRIMDERKMTLINAGPSPYGRKVEIALIEKGIDYDVVYDRPWENGSCTADYSPLQQLPILITNDGGILYDSSYIMLWLESMLPDTSMVPVDAEKRMECAKRQMLGERLMEVAQALIFEHHRPTPSSVWIERQSLKVEGALVAIERLYAERSSPSDSQIDYGDIAVGSTLLVLEHVVKASLSPDLACFRWRGRYNALTSRIVTLEGRESFRRTAPIAMTVNIGGTVVS